MMISSHFESSLSSLLVVSVLAVARHHHIEIPSYPENKKEYICIYTDRYMIQIYMLLRDTLQVLRLSKYPIRSIIIIHAHDIQGEKWILNKNCICAFSICFPLFSLIGNRTMEMEMEMYGKAAT